MKTIMLILFQMVARISGFMIFGVLLCITSIILYLDFYVSDPIFDTSTISQKPEHNLHSRFNVRSGKKYFHPIHSVNVHRTLLIQSDKELNKDDNISSPRKNAPSRLLKQTQVRENYTNSTERNTLNKLVVVEQKALNKVETSTPFGEFVFDYENTYVYEDDSVSSQGDSPPDGNSWLYRVPDQTHRFKQHNVAQQPKVSPKETDEDDAVFEDWKELEAIAQKTVQKDKNAASKTEPKQKHTDSKPGDSKTVHDASLTQRTGKIKLFPLKNKEGNNNNNEDTDHFINKVFCAMGSNNYSLQPQKRKLPNASKKSSNGIDVKQPVDSLPEIAAINVTEVKQRYNKSNRTDIPEELYRLAPDVRFSFFFF